MAKRIGKSYVNAWKWSAMRDEPRIISWLYRLGIFGSPIAFLVSATAFGISTNDWVATIFFYLFVLFSHPTIVVFIYYDYFYLLNKDNTEQ